MEEGDNGMEKKKEDKCYTKEIYSCIYESGRKK
jgi:hypothetical protein